MSSRDIGEVTRPIRIRTTVTTTGETATPLASCPRSPEAKDAHTCAGCMRMLALDWNPERGGEVRCLVSNHPTKSEPHADAGDRAARTTVSEIAEKVFTCVTPDLSLARVREILETTRQRAVVVVDAEGKLQALVSRSDLVRAPAEGTVADVMTSCVHALPEDAPISYAISLMAIDDIGEVPLVTREGIVTGICHSLGIVRWLADTLGYKVARR